MLSNFNIVLEALYRKVGYMHPSIADIVYKSKGNEKRYFVILKQVIQYYEILHYGLRFISIFFIYILQVVELFK